MFLTNATSKVVIEELEQNSVLVNILWSLVGVVVSSLLWGIRYRRETRAAATFGFYSHFRRILTELQRLFELCEKDGTNPYCLVYTRHLLEEKKEKLKVPFGTQDNCIANFKNSAEAIQKILSETTNNVYPLRSRKKRWYREQQVLYTFSQFILEDRLRNCKNAPSSFHEEEWEKLQKAAKYLAKKIDGTVY